MDEFKSILLHLQEGPAQEQALARAAALAKRNEARLDLVDVAPEFPTSLSRLVGLGEPESLSERAAAELRSRLERIAAPLRGQGLEVEVTVLRGTPFVEIIRRVLARGHDLVMVSAVSRQGWKNRLLGSTSQNLLRKCPRPVWVVKPAAEAAYRKVLAAVDPDPTDPLKESLNRRIIGLAAAVARHEGARLLVVHAWNPRWVPAGSRAEVWERWHRVARSEIEGCLEELVDELAGDEPLPRIRLVEGDPALAIAGLAEQEAVDLLVLGTVCRTGVAGFLIGNTAESLLQEVTCSLLAVQPEGFVSPVEVGLKRPEDGDE